MLPATFARQPLAAAAALLPFSADYRLNIADVADDAEIHTH